jgi:benzodiazapine receptor
MMQKTVAKSSVFSWSSLGVLAGFLVIVFAVSWFGSMATQTGPDSWYATLEKPFFQPPSWAFPVVWATLYALMAIAAWRVWLKGETKAIVIPLTLFFIQLAFNGAWSWVFFQEQDILGGLIVILILFSLILYCIRAFQEVDQPAAWMLWPYALWVAFAALLNGFILLLN